MFTRIEGRDSLVKDQTTGVVINTDNQALQSAKRAKKLALQRKEQNEHLEQRVEKLEKMLEALVSQKEGNKHG